MSAPEPSFLDRLHEIPDPASPRGHAAPPPPALPANTATRAMLQWRRRGALAFGAAWIALLAAHFGLRDVGGQPGLAVALAIWVLIGAGALAVAFRPGDRGLPPGIRQIQAVVALLPALYLLTVLVRAGAEPPATVPLSWATAGACFSVTHLLAVGPLVVAGLALQRSFLTNAAWRGALVGAVCGLGAAIGIHTHCPVETVSHILVAHGLAIVSGGVLGALLGALRGRA